MPKKVDHDGSKGGKKMSPDKVQRVQLTDEWRRLVDAWLAEQEPPNNTRQWLSRTTGIDQSTMMDLLTPLGRGGIQSSKAVHAIVRVTGLPYPTRPREPERYERLLEAMKTYDERTLRRIEQLLNDPQRLESIVAFMESIDRTEK